MNRRGILRLNRPRHSSAARRRRAAGDGRNRTHGAIQNEMGA